MDIQEHQCQWLNVFTKLEIDIFKPSSIDEVFNDLERDTENLFDGADNGTVTAVNNSYI